MTLLFCACCKKQRPHSIASHPVDPIPLDIPTPVSTQLYELKTTQENSHIYAFSHSHDASFYAQFYSTAMHDAGWHQESCVSGETATCFIFKKPRQWCTLLLEPQKVYYFVSERMTNK